VRIKQRAAGNNTLHEDAMREMMHRYLTHKGVLATGEISL
jgi:hypothetical protein